MRFNRETYAVEISDSILYVDNESRGRSGHMTHAMVEFAPGKIIDFNSNCSAVKHAGHSTFGFVEYRISEDGGETFSEIFELPYSKKLFYDGIYNASVEKAVACDDGRIVAICLRNSAINVCQPWDTPMVVTSDDGGITWSEVQPMPLPPAFACQAGTIFLPATQISPQTVLLSRVSRPEKECRRDMEICASFDGGKTFSAHLPLPQGDATPGYSELCTPDGGGTVGLLHCHEGDVLFTRIPRTLLH